MIQPPVTFIGWTGDWAEFDIDGIRYRYLLQSITHEHNLTVIQRKSHLKALLYAKKWASVVEKKDAA